MYKEFYMYIQDIVTISIQLRTLQFTHSLHTNEKKTYQTHRMQKTAINAQ